MDEVTSGSQWFVTAAYSGRRQFSYPSAWNALVGRYESLGVWGVNAASRVFMLKGQLMVDGSPLAAQKNGTFKLGSATVRFDTPAGGKMQRMWLDGFEMYRIDLP